MLPDIETTKAVFDLAVFAQRETRRAGGLRRLFNRLKRSVEKTAFVEGSYIEIYTADTRQRVGIYAIGFHEDSGRTIIHGRSYAVSGGSLHRYARWQGECVKIVQPHTDIGDGKAYYIYTGEVDGSPVQGFGQMQVPEPGQLGKGLFAEFRQNRVTIGIVADIIRLPEPLNLRESDIGDDVLIPQLRSVCRKYGFSLNE